MSHLPPLSILELVDCGYAQHPTTMNNLFTRHGATLHTLIIPSYSWTWLEWGMLSQCHNLQTLDVNGAKFIERIHDDKYPHEMCAVSITCTYHHGRDNRMLSSEQMKGCVMRGDVCLCLQLALLRSV